MANKRIYALTNTATALQAGDYIALDNSAYTEAKRLEASVLQTAIDLDGLTPTDGNFIVGDGSGWVAESGATVRTSMGLGSMATASTGDYLAATGATTGATSSAQDFTNGLTVAGGSNGISAAGVVTGAGLAVTGTAYATKSGTSHTTLFGVSAANAATGDYWTAIGHSAGASNSSGDGWTAIGYCAGTSNSSGAYWTAIGYFAAVSNSNGSSWVAIGESSAYSNSSGSNFVAIGRYAGLSNSAGGDWSAVGYGAGFTCTGSYWTGVGSTTAYSNTSGANWTAIGYQAARYINSGGNAATNTNFVAIGYDARFSADGTSNEIVIGYAGRGNGSNTTTIGNSSTTHFYGLGIHVLPSGGAPASAAATGTAGSIVWDADYIYICTATDTWKRVAIATW